MWCMYAVYRGGMCNELNLVYVLRKHGADV